MGRNCITYVYVMNSRVPSLSYGRLVGIPSCTGSILNQWLNRIEGSLQYFVLETLIIFGHVSLWCIYNREFHIIIIARMRGRGWKFGGGGRKCILSCGPGAYLLSFFPGAQNNNNNNTRLLIEHNRIMGVVSFKMGMLVVGGAPKINGRGLV